MEDPARKTKKGGKRRAVGSGRSLSSRSRTFYIVAAAAIVIAVVALAIASGDSPPWSGLGDADPGHAGGGSAVSEPTSTARVAAEDATGSTDVPGEGTAADSPTGSEGAVSDGGSDADGGSGSDAGDPDTSRNAVSQIEIPDFELPQTYEARVTVIGWASEAAGTIYLDVGPTRLMGAIDPLTGEETGPPADPTADQSVRFEDLTVLATTSEGVRDALAAGGSLMVRLVLVPAGDGAVFRLDRLAD